LTSFLIVDAQSVKNTDSADEKGYDAGKKVSGIKRHIAVDTQGLPHAIAVTTAEVTDRNGALAAIDRCKPNLELVESLLADGGYTGQPFADGVMERLDATVQIVKRNELHTFAVLPKRWIVERSFETVGNTPVVRINRLGPPKVNLYVKVEAFNPLGSVKGPACPGRD
jgi:transposase